MFFLRLAASDLVLDLFFICLFGVVKLVDGCFGLRLGYADASNI